MGASELHRKEKPEYRKKPLPLPLCWALMFQLCKSVNRFPKPHEQVKSHLRVTIRTCRILTWLPGFESWELETWKADRVTVSWVRSWSSKARIIRHINGNARWLSKEPSLLCCFRFKCSSEWSKVQNSVIHTEENEIEPPESSVTHKLLLRIPLSKNKPAQLRSCSSQLGLWECLCTDEGPYSINTLQQLSSIKYSKMRKQKV